MIFATITIKVVAAMESGKKNLKGPKTLAGVRKVPIPDEIFNNLMELKGDPFEPVFTQITTGKRHTENSRTKAWKNIMRHMDISMGAKVYRNQITISLIAQDLCPYCLRHTYCTDLQAKGVTLKTASYLMGHKSISETANIYTHITDEALAEASKLIGVSIGVHEEKRVENTVGVPCGVHEDNRSKNIA